MKKRQRSAPQVRTPRVQPETPPERSPDWQIYAAIAAILIIYVLLRLPGIGVPLDRDEGAFGHMGQIINQGGLPYRDGIDHKPPVAFYINAFALRFFPPTERGIHTFLLFYNFLTLVCLFYLAWIYFRSLSAGLWSAFAFAVFSASPNVQGFTASTEMWSLLPLTVSLLLAVLAIRNGSAALLFFSGVSGAVACWTKQTMAASVAFVFLYVVIKLFDRKNWIAVVRGAGVWLGGMVVFSAALGFYFYLHGMYREFLYWCVTYGFSYVDQASVKDTAEMLQQNSLDILKGNFVFFLVGIPVAIWGLFRRYEWAYFVLGFLVFSTLAVIPGFGYPHYFAQTAPAVALLAGKAFSVLMDRVRGATARFFAAAACGAVIVAGPLMADRDYFFEKDPNVISRAIFGDNPFPESKAVAEYIAQHTQPQDPVVIVGSEPQILYYAQRRSPSPFLMIYPLMSEHARYKEFQHRMLDDIKRNPPKYMVVMVHIPYSVMWDEKSDPAVMTSIATMIEKEYTLERTRLLGDNGGEWVEPGDSRLTREAPYISIFRRNGS